MIILITDIGSTMEVTAKQVVKGIRAARTAGLDCDEPEFLDFEFQVVTKLNNVERVTEATASDRTTERTGEEGYTQMQDIEGRTERGADGDTQVNTYESDA